MGNFIAIHVLRQYNPGTFNRGEDGDAKQVYIGGVNRVRFSSQCQKRAIREAMGCEEIRTSRIEEAINACLMNYVNDGTISDEERDLIGNAICSVAVLGSNSWKFLNPSEKNKESGGETDKSRVVTTTNADEIKALVTGMIAYYKEKGADALKLDSKGKNKQLTEFAKNSALGSVRISVAKSLFGAMATDGAIGTVDGAVEMGQAFSVDEYRPTSDFFSVKGTWRVNQTSDPFYGVFDNFRQEDEHKSASETINMGLDLYSNLMYSYANVNVKELERNLNTYIASNVYEEHGDTQEIMEDVIPKFVREMILMTPEATQNRSSSHVEPCAVLIEVIKDGGNLQPDWSDVVEGSQITEHAIARLGEFANSQKFRTGEIKQYVLFSDHYAKCAEDFKNATELSSLNELSKVMKDAVKELM